MRSLLCLLFLSFPLWLQAQSLEKDRVPREYAFEIGSKYIFSSSFDNPVKTGVRVGFDHAWKLSGFSKKSASYISVPIGYSFFQPVIASDSRMSILSYGWTVRHEMGRNKTWTPFVGYALLLSQLRFADMPGTVFGHMTGMNLGLNYIRDSRIGYFAKVEYSYTRYPSLQSEKSDRLHGLELRVGLRL